MTSSTKTRPRIAIVPQAVLQSQNRIAALDKRNTSMNPKAVNTKPNIVENSERSYRSCRSGSTVK
eukprot:CAMPEP_0197123904 /NCGR_PEP_ID=MMETSP1390-20130617/7113_1 /TAXON_ID=38833 /ORGANISM="Micromonas sp., Strain CCMP2099" /LENGTH=64 /DNA_ID=CAMNT_0042565983 /DNA_START=633 /DNA_END=827 /DNA_ORIENTATION=-